MSIRISGLDDVISRIRRLPPVLKEEVLSEVSDYALDVLREYPPQKYVSRADAYGTPFFTEKQRRFFFWALRSGAIDTPYNRTGTLADSWSARQAEGQVYFENSAPHAPYVMGFTAQSRHEAKVGWKKITALLSGPLSFRSSAFRAVVARAYQAALRRLNLG